MILEPNRLRYHFKSIIVDSVLYFTFHQDNILPLSWEIKAIVLDSGNVIRLLQLVRAGKEDTDSEIRKENVSACIVSTLEKQV